MDALRLHPYDKSHKRAALSLLLPLCLLCFLFCPLPPLPPPSLPTSKREKGANCLLWEPKIIELPSFFLLCLFLLFFFQAPPKERDSVRETRGKSLGIFLRNANVREPKSPDSDRRRFCAWQQQRDSLRVHLKFL